MAAYPLKRQDLHHISVCICTYKRAELLLDLLNKLRHQETGEKFSYSILVIDNDSLGSAESVVAGYSRSTHLETEYYIEKTQNISLARNKAVRNSSGEFIAFIDDDEVPEDNWLLTLYNALYRFGADAVLGPVLPRYKGQPPKWIIRGDFYKRRTYETGLRIDWRKGRTGNIMLKRLIFQNTEVPFDPNLGSGGEDQNFTRKMIGKGYVFVWCNEAIAYEVVPPLRWKRTFMLRRALLRGQVVQQYPEYRFIRLAKALLLVPIYALALPLLFIFGHHWFMQYLIKIMDYSGIALGMMKLDIIKKKYITE